MLRMVALYYMVVICIWKEEYMYFTIHLTTIQCLKADIRAQACNICDLPRPGSPTNRICISSRNCVHFALPPNKLNINPALTISWPYILGHNECTNNAKRFGFLYMSYI
ncbi:hypothetical protein ALC53_10211 [Atta colombica]|uniref:Uncharacterized protein n=1 Tax=Atta colombica TaxID=520822 RepID=A0A151I103_9HYME|nr:hypothetical protein ALC53_10211 [Atta colombica]